MPSLMQIDQVGLPGGTPDLARTDGLDTGALVTLTSTSPGSTNTFRLLWVPAEDTDAVASLAVTGNPAIWTFTPTAGVYGTYLIELEVDGVKSERVFCIRTPNRGYVIPALNEEAHPDASLISNGAAQVAASANNEPYSANPAINYAGWWPALAEIIQDIDDQLGSGGDPALGGDLSGTASSATVDTVGGQTAAAIASHVTQTTGNPHNLDAADVGADPAGTAASEVATHESTPGEHADAFHTGVAGEIAALTEKVSPVSGDLILIEDSAAGNAKKKVQISNLPGGGGTDADAIHDNVAAEISAITSKSVAVAGDILLIEDSADSNNKKSLLVSGIRITETQITDLDHTDADAIHDNVSGEIATVTEKTTPVGSDLLLIEDSAAGNAKKRVQISNLAGAFGDTFYVTLSTNEASLTHAVEVVVGGAYLNITQDVGFAAQLEQTLDDLGVTQVKLYDLGTPGTPIAPVLRSTLTFDNANKNNIDYVSKKLTPVASPLFVNNDEIFNTPRLYEVRLVLDPTNIGDPSDSALLTWSGITSEVPSDPPIPLVLAASPNVSPFGNQIWLTDDVGVNITQQPLPSTPSTYFSKIDYDAASKVFLACGVGSVGSVFRSTDGKSWLRVADADGTVFVYSIYWASTLNMWFALTSTSQRRSVNNGDSWLNSGSAPITGNPGQVVYHPPTSRYFCTKAGTSCVMYTTTGLSWTGGTATHTGGMLGIATSGTTLVMCANANTAEANSVQRSVDGTSWANVGPMPGGFGANTRLNGAAFNSGTFVLVGGQFTPSTLTCLIYYSVDDGLTWTQATIPGGYVGELRSVRWSAGLSRFIAVGEYSGFLESADGITWSLVHDTPSNDIVYFDSMANRLV